MELRVSLRPSEAPLESQPLAMFEVSLAETIEAQASQEVEAELEIAGALNALPSWEQLRVDVERY